MGGFGLPSFLRRTTMPLIKPKYTGLHRSADGKNVYRFVAGKEVDVKPEDLKALDKNDYEAAGKATAKEDK